MRLGQKLGLITSIFVIAILSAGAVLLDGDFDSGKYYSIIQTVPYSPARIAFEIKRTDNQALDGPRYAVLIDDHNPTTLEQRHALISFWRHRSFQLADPSVSIVWAGPNRITLTTEAPSTTPDWLMKQPKKIGDVVVTYNGRP